MKTKQSHILRITNFLILILVVSSCSNKELDSTDLNLGTYAWKDLGIFESAYNNYVLGVNLVVGDSLNLIRNNEFYYVTCGNSYTGKYSIAKDSLYLKIESTLVLKDSSKYDEKYTFVFYIKDQQTLIRYFKVKFSNNENDIEKQKVKSELHYVGDTLKNEK